MKVLHLTTHLNIGGITSYVYRLCEGLLELGISPSVASTAGEMTPEFEKKQIPVYRIPINTKNPFTIKLIRSWLKLQKQYARESWNLIHAHTRVSQCLALLLSKTLKIPYVTTFHGHYHYRFGRKLFPCLGHQTISISTSVDNDLKKFYPAYHGQITKILHGINTDTFHPNAITEAQKMSLKQKIGLKDLPVLGIVSRLSIEKGHVGLLEVLKYLLEHCRQNAQLLIVGEGKQKKDILQKIKDLNLENFVFLLPAQQDPRVALALIDIYVTYYEGTEGFGLSTLEAMAMGRPVVISCKEGGMTDFIEDGKDGYLMKEVSPHVMAEKISHLLNSKFLRENMGKQSYEKIKKHFSYKRMAEQTLRVYEKTL